ncbi:MAG: hypothetical protein Q7T05_03595 [Dehalococcoidia bacterium]|nr:hypothetical protein [Dehalococcoidia bacterium]
MDGISNDAGLLPIGGTEDAKAIAHLTEALGAGKNWYVALLEAIGLWCSSSEVHKGRRYVYLVGGEAFDWLLLAERLLYEIRGLISDEEVVDLLFSGKPPVELSRDQFKDLIGSSKYRAHLNFVYGVVVEEALVMAVEDAVHKERGLMWFESTDVSDEAFLRVYGASRRELLDRFQQQKGVPPSETLNVAELHEFTYWLFKFRMETCDPERVASDTRKALNQLRKAGARNLYL